MGVDRPECMVITFASGVLHLVQFAVGKPPVPCQVRQHIRLAVNLGEGLRHRTFIRLAIFPQLQIVVAHMDLQPVAGMKRACVHGAEHRHVLKQILSRLGKIAVANVPVTIDAIARFAEFQDAITFLADILQALHHIVGRRDLG